MSSTRPGGVSCPRRPAAATRLHHLRGSNRRQNGQRHPAPHSLITDRQLRCHQCVYSTVNKTSSTTTSTALLFYLSSSSSSSSSCHSPATTGAPHLRARTLPPPHPLPPAIRRHLVNVGCLPSALSPSSLPFPASRHSSGSLSSVLLSMRLHLILLASFQEKSFLNKSCPENTGCKVFFGPTVQFMLKYHVDSFGID